jgi:hexulose-6-phosphate isomerase
MMNGKRRIIGFTQGRFSPLVNGKIQAFPWDSWSEEFSVAYENDFNIIEWTLDQDRLYENPFMKDAGQREIKILSNKFDIIIFSVTGDCFMQAPFYKGDGFKSESLLLDLRNVIISCGKLGVKYIVFPLVDNGRLETQKQEMMLKDGLALVDDLLFQRGIKIVFESDFPPDNLKYFISRFPPENYGINYDIGNSAALGYNSKEEISAYGDRILNVHIKDRILKGTTVPLGKGNANIPKVLKELSEINYDGNYILQTARAVNESHADVLCLYRDQVINWME